MKQINKTALSAFMIGAFALVLANAADAMDQAPANDQEESESSETMDEVTVYGRQSLVLLRKEFELAQENMIVVFNSLNSTDEFDIECDYEQQLGSRRWEHVCLPKFATRQPDHEGAVFIRRNKQTDEVEALLHRDLLMDEKLWVEMSELIKESPELREAFTNLAAAKNAIETERQIRRDD